MSRPTSEGSSTAGGRALSALAFTTLRAADGADFESLYRLYEDALPARERKSAEALRALCASADYRVAVARTADGIAGFAILLVGRSMVLLEYMAVGAALRGHGIGSALYRWARDECAPPALPLLVEVDSDRERSADSEGRARRKHFYRRLGCRQIAGLDYLLPLPGEGPPPLMDLLVDSAAIATAVPRETVAAWLREIYRSAYGCEKDDPRLLAMINALPAEVTLS